MALRLGPWSGTYHPDYSIRIYSDGDPSRPLTDVNLRSVIRIQTSKSIDDIAGTFSITLKDRRAQDRIRPMDVVKISMRGHNQGWALVFVGVVDTPEPTGTADMSGSEADVTIAGRCTAKYLQINSLFLPVWDPTKDLPTALIFGLGDASQKLGTAVNAFTPREIFGYVFDHYVVGQRNRVGLSGTPNARFWLDRKSRFEYVKDGNGSVFQVPFIQFDENTTDQALTQLVVQGFTEGWVDEVGHVVYRRPAWDAPITWDVPTGGLRSWDLPESDTSVATYVEVQPTGVIGLPSGAAQAMLAGRAPIPSDYITGLQTQGPGLGVIASPEFIIDTDAKGQVTSNGARNWYYQRQKKYGLRPYMISSPLLASRAQAQAQAEGLLRFMLRWDKSGQITIPGEPEVRIGQTIRLRGLLEDQMIDRTYYVQAIAQNYDEGQGYTTTLTLSHGRDPGDPRWQQMVLPTIDLTTIINQGGTIPSAPSSQPSAGGFTFPLSTQAAVGIASWTLDDGVDIAAPAHATLYAVTSGTIVGHGIGGFGPSAPILQLDAPLSSYAYVYYGHAGPGNMVAIGTHVNAGDVVSEVGAGIVGFSTGPHLEIGFCNSGGTPIGPSSAPQMYAYLKGAFAG